MQDENQAQKRNRKKEIEKASKISYLRHTKVKR